MPTSKLESFWHRLNRSQRAMIGVFGDTALSPHSNPDPHPELTTPELIQRVGEAIMPELRQVRLKDGFKHLSPRLTTALESLLQKNEQATYDDALSLLSEG